MSRFYSKRKLERIPDTINVVNEDLERRNIVLQQRIFDMNWSIYTCIELLEKGNIEKTLKLLKKVMYE